MTSEITSVSETLDVVVVFSTFLEGAKMTRQTRNLYSYIQILELEIFRNNFLSPLSLCHLERNPEDFEDFTRVL